MATTTICASLAPLKLGNVCVTRLAACPPTANKYRVYNGDWTDNERHRHTKSPRFKSSTPYCFCSTCAQPQHRLTQQFAIT